MLTGNRGLHHLHTRKRVYKLEEAYPAENKVKKIVDTIMYMMGVIVPAMTIPQAAKIWLSESAVNVSLASWITFLINAIFWTFYGVLHKEKPLIMAYSLNSVVNAVIVLGIIVYS